MSRGTSGSFPAPFPFEPAKQSRSPRHRKADTKAKQHRIRGLGGTDGWSTGGWSSPEQCSEQRRRARCMMPGMDRPLGDLIGNGPQMEAVRDRVMRLLERQRDAHRLPPILIEGETGTGKGLLARMLHRAGPRADGPFVDVNCAAIPETLLEGEMFGFERGAFTDARRAKPGLLQAAQRGTIFLDEIGLLGEALQAKLLKALEERMVRRLGSTRDEPIDVWLITATNEDLRQAIRRRRFREDLYHRLAVVTLTMPPLRERRNAIVHPADHFLKRACADYGISERRLSEQACAALMRYPWPGNVRELANLMERLALLDADREISAAPPAPPEGRAPQRAAPAGGGGGVPRHAGPRPRPPGAGAA